MGGWEANLMAQGLGRGLAISNGTLWVARLTHANGDTETREVDKTKFSLIHFTRVGDPPVQIEWLHKVTQ